MSQHLQVHVHVVYNNVTEKEREGGREGEGGREREGGTEGEGGRDGGREREGRRNKEGLQLHVHTLFNWFPKFNSIS